MNDVVLDAYLDEMSKIGGVWDEGVKAMGL